MNHDFSQTGLSIHSRSMLYKATLALAGSALIAIAAQVTVPMFPVPMTLQTLAISVIGLTFGARLAALTLLVYLFEGAIGLPVFANAGAGAAKLVGPTAGYLWGFVAMAWLTGWLVERGVTGSVLRRFAAAALPAALLYVPGVLWLWAATPLDLHEATMAGAVPFVAGDLVKAAIAAVIVSGAARHLARR